MSTPTPKLQIGFVLFPGFTQLDMAGPYEVLSALPENSRDVYLIWEEQKPVADTYGTLKISPTTTFDHCLQLDLICVPGAPPEVIKKVIEKHPNMLSFLKRQASGAKYITSVCTGSLILSAAGLLDGYKATCHWQYRAELAANKNITVINKRVVVDRNRITGGGVTAGIDFGLLVAQEIAGAYQAISTQLTLEYSPAPLFALDSCFQYQDKA